MKRSKYNIIRKKPNKDIIFNSFTLAASLIDEDFYNIYNNLNKLDLFKLSEKEKKIFLMMKEAGYIIENDIDELKMFEFQRLQELVAPNLILNIFPTLSCNFDCYYCFENNKTGIITEKVEEKIYEIIENYAKKGAEIRIDWWGGEPLLVLDRIEKITGKTIKLCEKYNVKYKFKMITNGYLLDDKNIKNLKKCKVDSIQVTIDGPPEIHDKRRYLKKNKGPTFNKIIENIKKIFENNINVLIRINVNKEIQINSIINLLQIFENENFKINFYLANERKTDSNLESNCNCFSVKEFSKFQFDFFKKLKLSNLAKYNKVIYFPNNIFNFCDATRLHSLYIDPVGNVYKCSEDVGNEEKSYTNIITKKQKKSVLADYMTWTPLKHKKCIKCNILPICSANCPKIGIERNEPECINWKYSINDIIDSLIE